MRSLRRIAPLCICATLSFAQAPQLQLPTALAYDAVGNLYIADTNRNQVLEATLAGTLVVVAGTGTQGFAGDNGPATAAELNAPQGLAFGPDGTLYIADTGNHRIRTVTAGQITTLSTAFRSPTALALDPTGALLVCDTADHRIRRIANSTVTTVAGNGTQGFAGDGGPATAAELDTPLGIAAFGTGAFYIADAHNNRIRSVGLDGIIHTIAGAGTQGFSGDGGPATLATLARPHGLLLTTAGLVFSDANNQRLRLIDTSGKITTLAGSGTEGKAADGDATLSAMIDTPAGLALSPFGKISFADSANYTVRVIASNQLFVPAALAPARHSTITVTSASPEVYGAASTMLSVTGSIGTPQGSVQMLDGNTVLAMSTLANGASSIALPTLNAGQHLLTAAYLGDGLNAASAVMTDINVVQAPSSTAQSAPALGSYAGMPVTLAAQVSSGTQGQPTGAVQFLEGTNIVATGRLYSGIVSAIYLNPAAGTHSLQAVYGGDSNFLSSSSASVSLVVQAMPDFILTSPTPAQTVQGGSIATYPITIASQPGPFTGAVSLTASGLPTAATVSFSPAQAVPGAASATVQMSITTPATVVQNAPCRPAKPMLAVLLLSIALVTKRKLKKALLTGGLCVSLCTSLGCGSRSIAPPATTPSSYTITVKGTSTNLAGAVVAHTTVVQLTVR